MSGFNNSLFTTVLVGILFAGATVSAQPVVLSVSPEQNEQSASQNSNIAATFSENMSGGTSQTFVVHGSMTGTLSGNYSGEGSTVLTFDPSGDFFPGEKIAITLTTGLRQFGIGGPFLSNDVVWEFLALARSGVINFPSGSDVSGDEFSTTEVVLADMDGDGNLDLVTGNFESDNRLFINNGTSAPFSGVSSIELSGGFSTHSIAVCDVNNDGNLDLVEGTNPGNGNYYLLSKGGSNPFSGVAAIPLAGGNEDTFSVVLGDVDGDGDLDLVEGNFRATNRLHLNNGSSDPWDGINPTNVTSEENRTQSLTLGDVDNDGDLDLVEGNGNGGSFMNRLFLNNGTSDPWSGVEGIDIGTQAFDTRKVLLGDVDNDGDLDLIAGNRLQNSQLFLNNGTANPWDGVTPIAIGSSPIQVSGGVLGDLDGDGDLDLVLTQGIHDNLRNKIFVNNGTSNPWSGVEGTDLTTDTRNTAAVTMGDVDGDGDLDIVTGETRIPTDSTNSLMRNRVYINNGFNPAPSPTQTESNTPTEAIPPTQTPTPTATLTPTPIDTPSGPFVLSVSPPQNESSAPGESTIGATFSESMSDSTTQTFVVHGMQSGRLNGIYTGGGSSTLSFDSSQPLNPGEKVQVSLTSNLRAFGIGGPFLASPVVWEFVVSAKSIIPSFIAGLDISSDANRTIECALGDIDGDGDLDFVAGNLGSTLPEINRYYLNNGTSNPWNGVTGVNVTNESRRTLALSLGDVDGDGDLDLLEGNRATSDRLYLNDGSGNPWDTISSTAIGSEDNDTHSILLGDVDGDGDMDLVKHQWIVATSSYSLVLFLNNGTTAPFDGVEGIGIDTFASDLMSSEASGISDFDNDGDLDVIAGNRLYLNNGSSNPWNGVSHVALDESGFVMDIAVGDVDGDGDADVVFSIKDSLDRIFLNNGSATPFVGVAGLDIPETSSANAGVCLLPDLNGDGYLDYLRGVKNGINHFLLNNQTTNPWLGVSSQSITNDANDTDFLVVGDCDGDGDLDVIGSNTGLTGEINRFYQNGGFNAPSSPTPTVTNTSTITPTFTETFTPTSTPTLTPDPDVDGSGFIDANDLLLLMKYWHQQWIGE